MEGDLLARRVRKEEIGHVPADDRRRSAHVCPDRLTGQDRPRPRQTGLIAEHTEGDKCVRKQPP